jgi:hypothetical protein
VYRVGEFGLHQTINVLVVAAGGLLTGIQLATWFGRHLHA